MKKIILVAILLIALSIPSLATDDLLLETPAPLCTDDTYTMKIRHYKIVPPPVRRIEVSYNLCDSQGAVFKQGVAVIDGSDFTDVINFSIRAQDVGTGIGAGLKTLIWNKLEILYGITFQ